MKLRPGPVQGCFLEASFCGLFLFSLVALLSGPLGGAAAGSPGKRTAAELKATLTRILSAKDAKGDLAQALSRLKAYRYLAGIPYDDLVLDEEFNKYCLAGAKLCEKLGRLEHKPERPADMSEEEFKIAYLGTSRSSLGAGFKSLDRAVDGWMDDSDPGNIAHLGHRRWCLNPPMKKVGFGRSGIFSAMYVFDHSRGKGADYEFVAWPPAGPMPIEFFGKRHAWNVSLNPTRFKPPSKDVEPRVFAANASGETQGEALKLDHVSVSTIPFGIPNCIVFRPADVTLSPGARYMVEIDGLEPLKKGGPTSLRYLVEFVKWK